MSFEEEEITLKELVTKALQANGILGKIQAQLRASVFLALDEEFKNKSIPLINEESKSTISSSFGVLAASLIHDFMETLNLDFSKSVFGPESGACVNWQLHSRSTISAALQLNDEELGTTEPLLIGLLKKLNVVVPETECTDLNNTISIEKGESFRLKNSSDQSDKSESSSSSKQSYGETVSNAVKRLEKLTSDSSSLHKQHIDESSSNATTHASNAKSEEPPQKQSFSICNKKEADNQEEESEVQESEEGSSSHDKNKTEDEVEEDIEEDLSSENGINSLTSPGSECTKDISVSQATDVANYQEDI